MSKPIPEVVAPDQINSPKKIRLFLAVNLPKGIKDSIEDCRRKFASRLDAGSVRWTRSEQLHITLKFIGYVTEDSATEITNAVAAACRGTGPLTLTAEALGCFPRVRSPRVLWVGISGDVEPLLLMQKRIDSSTAQWAEPEKREFTPHLTLARLKEPKPKEIRAIGQFIEANKAARFGEWQARQVDLMQSVLSPNGATYRAIASIALT
ncbi:MAG TPA: RNA 2',3'-cyclic phosphodiesterase [Verrucomicrobiae bacterium]|nr:RNA 2',3'-cyclic phosphodiesterase [Verrucomicrobiae bacterium]